jgi:TonB-dependent starch-binding outer membrane protein SusC
LSFLFIKPVKFNLLYCFLSFCQLYNNLKQKVKLFCISDTYILDLTTLKLLITMLMKRLLRQIGLPILLLLLSTAAFSQNKTVTGKVTDKSGNSVSGVSVTAKGSTRGTTTDANGNFTLSIPNNVTTLVFSSVGYERQEMPVGSGSVNVTMNILNANLNEVVVVGYETRKVKDLTGSVSSVSSKDFNKGVIASPQELFQGRTPGVTVTASSGEPGAAISVNIRGAGSIYNSEPLYIVDGVPVYGGSPGNSAGSTSSSSTGVEGSTTAKNPLAFLNPSDIESVTILKDASSTAIYGAAGANGVVIITTKSGKGAKGGFTFGTSLSVSNPASRFDLLNAQDFLVAVKKANIDAGTDPATAAAAVLNVDKGASTDWQNQIFQSGIAQNYNLGWGFANRHTALRLSGSYDDQKGIVKNSSLKRATIRANFSQKFLNDKLKFEENVTFANIKNQYPPNSNNAGYQGSLIGAAIAFNPTYPVKNPDGSFFDPNDGNRNPAEMLAYFTSTDNINRIISNTSISYTILKGLTYKGTLGVDASNSLKKNFADPRLGGNFLGDVNTRIGTKNLNNPITGNGRALYQNNKYNSLLIDHLLTYDKAFSNGHVLNAFIGYHYQTFNYYNWNDLRWGLSTAVTLPTDVFVKDINNFTTKAPFTFGDTSKGKEQSFFAKANYTINDKYYFTASVRTDGDSRFGENNKYGTFPSGAFKWRISNENFAQNNIAKIFNDLSVRASYGVVGSKGSVPLYGSLAVRQVYVFGAGDTSVQNLSNANPDLKWESTAAGGVGIDFVVLGNRLKGSIDYYHKNTKNLIFYNYFLPRSNSPYRWENLKNASVINKGIEINLDALAIKKNKFQWEIVYNMAFNKNRVIKLPTPINTGQVNGQGLSGAYAQQIVNNHALFTWKMPVFMGLDGNGDARYANGSNDALLGNPIPKFTAGLTNNFTIGNWNAGFFFNSSRGFYIYNNTANALFLKGSLKTGHNVTYEVANSPEDPINPGSVSSRFLEKGDFIRLSNASVGYTFKIKNGYIKSLNVGLSGQNLLLITKYSGLDPEVNIDHSLNGVPSRGFDYAGYPKARTFTFGVNMGF